MKPHEAVSQVLIKMAEMAKIGVRTIDIDSMAEKMILDMGCKPFNKGYKHQSAKQAYPFTTCINIDNVIAHGKPSEYKLQNGDLVSLDVALITPDGLCGDAALSLGCGEISNRKERLLKYAKKTLYEVIDHMKPGRSTEDLARICEYYTANMGYRVNLRMAGHAIGTEMHMKPNIYSGTADHCVWGELKVGDVFCVEPMLTPGKDNLGICVDPDGWTFVTVDGQPSAFFEHMVEITATGCKILTTHFDRN